MPPTTKIVSSEKRIGGESTVTCFQLVQLTISGDIYPSDGHVNNIDTYDESNKMTIEIFVVWMIV